MITISLSQPRYHVLLKPTSFSPQNHPCLDYARRHCPPSVVRLPFPSTAPGSAAYISTTSPRPRTRRHWVPSVPDPSHLSACISLPRIFFFTSHYPSVEQLHLPGRFSFASTYYPVTTSSFVYSQSNAISRHLVSMLLSPYDSNVILSLF